MTVRGFIQRTLEREDFNFLLTNRIVPRRTISRFAGWFSRIEQPLVCNASIAAWRFFSDLDLSEAQHTDFRSLRDCFTRTLKPGLRPIEPDPDIMVSPCDGIVGAHGAICGTDLYQIKGSRYALAELLRDPALVETYRNGVYVTLRLTSSMYHRFHAPHDCTVEHVGYIRGDSWNVNPPALRRVEKLYCRNERAVLRTSLAGGGGTVTLVPVGAVLVSGIRLRFADIDDLRRSSRTGLACSAPFSKGDEMGWFEHGSTIIVLAPEGFRLCARVADGALIRVGEPLMRLP